MALFSKVAGLAAGAILLATTALVSTRLRSTATALLGLWLLAWLRCNGCLWCQCRLCRCLFDIPAYAQDNAEENAGEQQRCPSPRDHWQR